MPRRNRRQDRAVGQHKPHTAIYEDPSGGEWVKKIRARIRRDQKGAR